MQGRRPVSQQREEQQSPLSRRPNILGRSTTNPFPVETACYEGLAPSPSSPGESERCADIAAAVPGGRGFPRALRENKPGGFPQEHGAQRGGSPSLSLSALPPQELLLTAGSQGGDSELRALLEQLTRIIAALSQHLPPQSLMLQWNCNGLGWRLIELRLHLRDKKNAYEALAIQEPKCSTARVSGYIPYYSTPARVGDEPRAMLLVRRGLTQSRLALPDIQGPAEIVAVTLLLAGDPLHIASVYIPGNATWDPLDLCTLRAQVGRDRAIICGDFNAHSEAWGDRKTDTRGKRLQETLERTDLFNITARSPTYVGPRAGGSIIDLTLVTPGLRLSARPLPDSWGSDHVPIEVGTPKKATMKTCKVTDWDHYRALIAEGTAAGLPFSSQLIEDAIRVATRTVQVPSTRPNPDFLWLKLRARRRQAQRRSWRTNRPEDILAYKRLNAKFRRHGRRLAGRQWRLLCASFGAPGGGKLAWKMVQTLGGLPISRSPVLCLAAHRHLSPTALANFLANSLFTAPTPPPPSGHAHPMWWMFEPLTAPAMQAPDADFGLHELQHALQSAPRRRTTPGPDGISAQALRNLDEGTLPQLLAFLNNIWRTTELPSEGKEAVAVPIPKPGKDPNDPTSYRPISLTSCKTMERMVLRRLNYHLEAAGTLPECFSVFRTKRCTADSIGDLVSSFEETKAKGHSAALVMLDIHQAFDALPHAPIIDTLRRLGVAGQPLRFVQAFLSDRSVTVKGSVISPLLFSAGMSSILAAARAGVTARYPVNVAVYTDDVALWVTGQGVQERRRAVTELQRTLKNVIYHPRQLGLTVQ
ncbi:hypothetical protein HPB47_000971 [Ixodes persulcatus]|uniref:Uncharacterized protein n=1 Tax=Ixodes persulcatus TaxID=34615 RepID=A0AC60PRU4_IXOPE|nr:hypothetical protein HPB47_000971 [Ixodes persulcatus]